MRGRPRPRAGTLQMFASVFSVTSVVKLFYAISAIVFCRIRSSAEIRGKPYREIPELSCFAVFTAQAMRGVLCAIPNLPRASSKIIPPCPCSRDSR